MRIQCRTIWIAAGLLGVILIGGWLLHEPIRDRLFSQTDGPAHSRQMEHPQGEHGVSGPQSRMPAGTGPSQASAMVSPAKQQLIGVTTAMVEKRPLGTVIRAVGRVEYDEQRIAHVNLRISGWVQDLFVDYTGQFVRKSQPLLTLYSPELVASQDEYLLALRTLERVKDSPLDEAREQAERMVESARERLRLWTLTDQQLEEIARRGKARTSITIVSPAGGYVIDKQVFKGMYVEPQMTVYRIADLSRVWINAEIYEFEVPFVQVGQPAEVTISSYPGEMFRGRVSYIYPYLNEQTRTVKVRLDLANPDLRLKPDMYGNILINVDRGTRLAVPEQAVLDSGTKTMVFLVRGEGLFEPREVTLGPKIGSFYEVQEGLRAGDRVVTSGTFLIDSESKLMAATNMMGSLGMGGVKMERARMGEMEMGGMKMGRTPSAPAAAQAKQEKQVDGLLITLSTEPDPPRPGENRVVVKLKDKAGKPMSDVKVLLAYTMPMPGMVPATLPMEFKRDERYEAAPNLGMAGQWDLTVIVQRPGLPEVKATFSVMTGG